MSGHDGGGAKISLRREHFKLMKFGTDPFDDLIDASRGHADVLCDAVFREAKRVDEILTEDLAGMNWSVCFHGKDQ